MPNDGLPGSRGDFMDFLGSYACRSFRQWGGVEIVATQDLHMDADCAVIGGDKCHSGRDLETYTMISTLFE